MLGKVFRKSRLLLYNVETYGGAKGATNYVTTWRIRFACWIRKTSCSHAHAHALAPGHPHSRTRKHTQKYVISCLLLFTDNNNSRTRLTLTLYVHFLSSILLKFTFVIAMNVISSTGTFRSEGVLFV